MINGNLCQFLDTGWWNADATIYYKEHIYFLEGFFDKEEKNAFAHHEMEGQEHRQ